MATTSGTIRQSVVSQRNVHVRRRSTLYVGLGDDVFWVPRQAAEAIEYPLLGVKHTVLQVPREETWPALRGWLAYEQKQSGDNWDLVWSRCQRLKSKFFRRYEVVLLARPSRLLPAGNVVFRSMTDIVTIPSSELNYLSPYHRRCVQQAFTEAVMHLPSEKRLHFFQPVYTSEGDTTRLVTVQEVATLAQERRESLREFCAQHSQRARLKDSPEHINEAWEQYARQYTAARKRLLQSRSLDPLSLTQMADREEAFLKTLAHRLGIKAETGRLQRFALSLIDPILAFEEPSWKLPIYGNDVTVLRTVAHWDDHGVTLLR